METLITSPALDEEHELAALAASGMCALKPVQKTITHTRDHKSRPLFVLVAQTQPCFAPDTVLSMSSAADAWLPIVNVSREAKFLPIRVLTGRIIHDRTP